MKPALLNGTPVRTKPFPAWPDFTEAEESAILEVLRSRNWGGYSRKVGEFEKAFAALHCAPHAIACANGTVALEVALRAVGVRCGDEVVVTPFSFVASASTILMCHGVPVFADIDPRTMNIDPAALEAAITPRTRAAVVVHFGGHPADMDAIGEIARRHNIAIIEDSAHAHGAQWNGIPVGNFGAVGTFSFQAFKLATAGEGGLMITNSAELADRIWAYCNQGRRKDGAWFQHFTIGSNYRLTGFQAAVLVEQTARIPEQTRVRTANADYLRSQLRSFTGVSTADTDPRVQAHPQYMMTLRYDPTSFSGLSRERFVKAIGAEGIPMGLVYPHPLYRNPLFRKEALPPDGCGGWHFAQDYESLHLPEVEKACRDGLWLEHSVFLGTQSDMDDIMAAFRKVQAHAADLNQAQESTLTPAGA